MILARKPLLLVIETRFNTARHRSDAIVIVVVGCVIAAIAPFDTAFAYLSNGSALARVCLFAVIGTCGAFLCREKWSSTEAVRSPLPDFDANKDRLVGCRVCDCH